jgi:putative ABC transport system permease protein
MIAVLCVSDCFQGSYPALVLSGFKPIEVLKTRSETRWFKYFYKVFGNIQFVLSAGLIISTIIIMQQLHYMRSKSPGFDKENIVVVDANGVSDTKKIFALFKQELSSHPEIVDMASSDLGLGEDQGWSESAFKYNGTDKTVYEYFVDPGYLHTLGLQLLAGRNFDPNIASDSVNSVIVNETMVRDFGWTMQNAIGQQITGYRDNLTPVVIGVVKNFNFFAFSKEIEPQMFQQFSSYLPYKFFVRIKRGDPSTALTTLQASWKKIAPDYPLKYNFLDENLNRFYQSEVRWSNIVGWAGGVSIFLPVLVLPSLAALAAVNRTKK